MSTLRRDLSNDMLISLVYPLFPIHPVRDLYNLMEMS